MAKIPFVIQDQKIIDKVEVKDKECFEEKKKHHKYVKRLKELKANNGGLTQDEIEDWKAIRLKIQALEKEIHDTIEDAYKNVLGIKN